MKKRPSKSASSSQTNSTQSGTSVSPWTGPCKSTQNISEESPMHRNSLAHVSTADDISVKYSQIDILAAESNKYKTMKQLEAMKVHFETQEKDVNTLPKDEETYSMGKCFECPHVKIQRVSPDTEVIQDINQDDPVDSNPELIDTGSCELNRNENSVTTSYEDGTTVSVSSEPTQIDTSATSPHQHDCLVANKREVDYPEQTHEDTSTHKTSSHNVEFKYRSDELRSETKCVSDKKQRNEAFWIDFQSNADTEVIVNDKSHKTSRNDVMIESDQDYVNDDRECGSTTSGKDKKCFLPDINEKTERMVKKRPVGQRYADIKTKLYTAKSAVPYRDPANDMKSNEGVRLPSIDNHNNLRQHSIHSQRKSSRPVGDRYKNIKTKISTGRGRPERQREVIDGDRYMSRRIRNSEYDSTHQPMRELSDVAYRAGRGTDNMYTTSEIDNGLSRREIMRRGFAAFDNESDSGRYFGDRYRHRPMRERNDMTFRNDRDRGLIGRNSNRAITIDAEFGRQVSKREHLDGFDNGFGSRQSAGDRDTHQSMGGRNNLPRRKPEPYYGLGKHVSEMVLAELVRKMNMKEEECERVIEDEEEERQIQLMLEEYNQNWKNGGTFSLEEEVEDDFDKSTRDNDSKYIVDDQQRKHTMFVPSAPPGQPSSFQTRRSSNNSIQPSREGKQLHDKNVYIDSMIRFVKETEATKKYNGATNRYERNKENLRVTEIEKMFKKRNGEINDTGKDNELTEELIEDIQPPEELWSVFSPSPPPVDKPTIYPRRRRQMVETGILSNKTTTPEYAEQTTESSKGYISKYIDDTNMEEDNIRNLTMSEVKKNKDMFVPFSPSPPSGNKPLRKSRNRRLSPKPDRMLNTDAEQ